MLPIWIKLPYGRPDRCGQKEREKEGLRGRELELCSIIHRGFQMRVHLYCLEFQHSESDRPNQLSADSV